MITALMKDELCPLAVHQVICWTIGSWKVRGKKTPKRWYTNSSRYHRQSCQRV